MSETGLKTAAWLVAAMCWGMVTGARAQGVHQNHQSDAPSMSFAWQWSATPAQQQSVCQSFEHLDSIEVVRCRSGALDFRVKPGQSVRLSELNSKIQAVVAEAHISLGGASALGVFELVLPDSYDAGQDDAFQGALQSRSTVASVEHPGARHFKVTLQEGRTFGFGQLMQLYVRALHHRGRIMIDDIVADVVFYGPAS